MSEAPRIFATFRYMDPAAMVEWLCETIGFTVKARYPETDEIAHAELAFGSAMIMLGATRDDDYGKIVGGPGSNGGKSLYIAVDDVDALFERVKASGAAIEQGLIDRDYGSREFICRDPEGNIWCFGTYWPRADD
ncbi:MAG: glyoxalase [Ahrensia sp.]|nr:glyoxalase [Ahrensia sp.]